MPINKRLIVKLASGSSNTFDLTRRVKDIVLDIVNDNSIRLTFEMKGSQFTAVKIPFKEIESNIINNK